MHIQNRNHTHKNQQFFAVIPLYFFSYKAILARNIFKNRKYWKSSVSQIKQRANHKVNHKVTNIIYMYDLSYEVFVKNFQFFFWINFEYFRFEMGIFGEITSTLCRYESFWENNNIRKSFVESLLTFSRIWGGTSSKNSNFKKCWRINTELIFCLILKIIHFVIMDLMVLLQRFVLSRVFDQPDI